MNADELTYQLTEFANGKRFGIWGSMHINGVKVFASVVRYNSTGHVSVSVELPYPSAYKYVFCTDKSESIRSAAECILDRIREQNRSALMEHLER